MCLCVSIYLERARERKKETEREKGREIEKERDKERERSSCWTVTKLIEVPFCRLSLDVYYDVYVYTYWPFLLFRTIDKERMRKIKEKGWPRDCTRSCGNGCACSWLNWFPPDRSSMVSTRTPSTVATEMPCRQIWRWRRESATSTHTHKCVAKVSTFQPCVPHEMIALTHSCVCRMIQNCDVHVVRTYLRAQLARCG